MQSKNLKIMLAITLSCSSAGHVLAAIDGDVNWADDVSLYTASIQNYNGTLLNDLTTWWLTGPSDADANGNGYAWDVGDPDYVAGWRSASPNESITMWWETGIPDVTGADLTIRLYGGSSGSASVFASTDDNAYTLIGTVAGQTPGYLFDATFDFAGLLDDVHYIKVTRDTSGPQTGLFFDSFAGAVVPEPVTLSLMSVGMVTLSCRRRRG